MKNKLILLFVMLIAFSCTTDTDFQEELDLSQIEEDNSEVLIIPQASIESNSNTLPIDNKKLNKDITNINKNPFGGNGGRGFGFENFNNLNCGNWNPALYLLSTDPQANNFRVYEIVYSSIVTSQNQANCIRKEFFDHNRNLELLVDNDNNFRTELWVDKGSPRINGSFAPKSRGRNGATTPQKADSDPRVASARTRP